MNLLYDITMGLLHLINIICIYSDAKINFRLMCQGGLSMHFPSSHFDEIEIT